MKKFTFLLFLVLLHMIYADQNYFYRLGKKVYLNQSDNPVVQKKSEYWYEYVQHNGVPFYITSHLYVKLHPDMLQEDLDILLDAYNLKLVDEMSYLKNWLYVKSENNPVTVAAKIVEDSAAAAAEPSFAINIEQFDYHDPGDTYFSQQWYLHSETKDHAHVAQAWKFLKDNGIEPGEKNGERVRVAVVDSGFDIDHEDLVNQFVAKHNMGLERAEDMFDPYVYSNFHGTACAGIIAAEAGNNLGIAGSCPGCGLIAIRRPESTMVDKLLMDSFPIAVDNGADVISNSWGPTLNEPINNPTMGEPMQDLLEQYATKERDGKGVVIIFAAGNDSYDFTTNNGLAASNSTIAIGATDNTGTRAGYSNFGYKLDVMAPSGASLSGDALYTTDSYSDKAATGYDFDNSKYYKGFSGTSAAAPLAAGISGLVMSANPELSAKQIKYILRMTADKVGPEEYSNGRNNNYGYGRINALEAVKMAIDFDPSTVIDDDREPVDDSGETQDTGSTPVDTGNNETDNGNSQPDSGIEDTVDDNNETTHSNNQSESDNSTSSVDKSASGESNDNDDTVEDDSGCALIFV